MRSPRTSGGLSLSEVRRRSPSVLVVALSSALALACFASAPALTASAQPSLAVTSNLDFPKLAGSNAVCASTAPGNPCTLRAAIETVNAGFDTGAEITLPASAFVLTLNPVRGPLDATASMSIIGHGAGQSVIDGNRQTGVLQVEAAATVTVTGLSILHGEGFYGGGIFSSGTLTLNGVTVAFNHAAHGGGIATFGAGLTMRGGSVTSNVAIAFGGGVVTAGPAAITATTVSSNQSGGGGGITTFGGTLALTGVTISGNAGLYGGGGIALGVGNVPGAVTINDSTISGNTSPYVGTHGGIGGGIVAVATTLTINRSTVTGNAAGAVGGGIAVDHSTLALTNDTITRNTAPLGGGIFQVATGATVNPGGAAAHESLLQLPAATAGLLLSRPAPATRTGPHVAPPATPNEMTVNSSTVAENTATTGGGILNAGTLALNNVRVAFNQAADGAGINNVGFVTMHGGSVESNIATSLGGGVAVGVGASFTATGTAITGNQAASGGGVVSLGGVTLSGVTVSGNTARTLGGGMALGSTGFPSVTTVTGTTISGNTATSLTGVGGGIYVDSSTLTMTRSTLIGNAAPVSGGGIFVTFSSVVLTNDTLTKNSAGRGGAIEQGSFFATTNPGASMAQAASHSSLAVAGRAPGRRPAKPDDVSLTSSTVAGNSAATGGGLANQTGFFMGAHDSIVALNQAPTGPDCAGVVTSAGYNLESQAGCNFAGAGDKQNTNPLLAAPAGAPPETMAPQAGSPAIDAGDPACPPPATDEVGTARPQGPRCDIGAVEVPAAAAPLPAPPSTGRG